MSGGADLLCLGRSNDKEETVGAWKGRPGATAEPNSRFKLLQTKKKVSRSYSGGLSITVGYNSLARPEVLRRNPSLLVHWLDKKNRSSNYWKM